VAAKSKSRLV